MSRRGVALVLVLFVAIMILLVGGATALLLQGRGRSENLSLDSQRALYFAEAGQDYIRAAVSKQCAAVVASTTPRGIQMPTLTFTQILVALKVEVDPEGGFRIGPKPIRGANGETLGYFVIRLGLTSDAIGSPDMTPVASPKQPAGLGWLPILFCQCTGLVGSDSNKPTASRRVLAILKPLPPPVVKPALLPDETALADSTGKPRTDIAPTELLNCLPSYGVPGYEISDYADMGTPDPYLWVLDNTPEDPTVYPPCSTLPGQRPEPWWFLPRENGW